MRVGVAGDLILARPFPAGVLAQLETGAAERLEDGGDGGIRAQPLHGRAL